MDQAGKEKIRIKYYECNMTKMEHLAAYLVFSAAIAVILYIYYHFLPVSVAGGLLIAFFRKKTIQNRLCANVRPDCGCSLKNSWSWFPYP